MCLFIQVSMYTCHFYRPGSFARHWRLTLTTNGVGVGNEETKQEGKRWKAKTHSKLNVRMRSMPRLYPFLGVFIEVSLVMETSLTSWAESRTLSLILT